MDKQLSPNQPKPEQVPGNESPAPQILPDENATQEDGEGETDPPGGIRPTKPPIIP